jgi:hypothetical protein
MKTKLIAVALICSLSTGCIPAMIIALAVDSNTQAKNQATRQQFIKDFNARNDDREAKKLPALSWCEEVLRFDKVWWKQQKECQPIFVRYPVPKNSASK